MSWTYSGDPSVSRLDEIRFQIGDTKEADPLLSNEEIEYYMNEYESNLYVLRELYEHLVARYAREADIELGPKKIKASQRYEQLQQRLTDIKRKIASTYSMPIHSYGTAADTGFNFDIGMHDNPVSSTLREEESDG